MVQSDGNLNVINQAQENFLPNWKEPAFGRFD